MNFINNKRVFAKIEKDCNGCYAVDIKTVYDTCIGKIPVSRRIPFLFKSLEIAKDFVSVLPDKIERCTIKSDIRYKGELFKNKYHTYKLYIGDLEIYVDWQWINNKPFFLDDSCNYITKNFVVCTFTSSIIINKYGNTYYGSKDEYLSKLVKYLKENIGALTPDEQNTYIFELVQQ